MNNTGIFCFFHIFFVYHSKNPQKVLKIIHHQQTNQIYKQFIFWILLKIQNIDETSVYHSNIHQTC